MCKSDNQIIYNGARQSIFALNERPITREMIFACVLDFITDTERISINAHFDSGVKIVLLLEIVLPENNWKSLYQYINTLDLFNAFVI